MKKDVDLRFTLPTEARSSPVLDRLAGKVALDAASSRTIDQRAREAALGNAQAQYELAKALTSGSPLASENREAVKWLKKAVEKEHAQSEHLLGILIARAQGVRANPALSHSLFRKAATVGYAPAQYDLARSLLWGFGCEANAQEALTWFRLAAAQGHALSQKESATAYLEGRGCRVDLRQATSYLRKAVLNGLTDCARQLGELYLREDNPASNDGEAIRWISEAARNKDAKAQYLLALFYQSGRITEARADTGLDWAIRSAQEGFLPAYLLLAKIVEKKENISSLGKIKSYALLTRALKMCVETSNEEVKRESNLRLKELELTLATSEIESAKNLAKSAMNISEIAKRK